MYSAVFLSAGLRTIFGSMIHHTKGIVLRQVKYGDTSLVVTVYTEGFGVQSYMVQGVRSDKKGAHKANLYHPATVLDMVVDHHPQKNLQRIKECKIHYWYESTYKNMIKSSLSMYCVELFSKVITEPEGNTELFQFLENVLIRIDQADLPRITNIHLLFTLELITHLGFGIQESYSEETPVLDLMNGQYTSIDAMKGLSYADGPIARMISDLNQSDLETLHEIPLNHHQRNDILLVLIRYLQMHIPSMSAIKCVAVLQEILE